MSEMILPGTYIEVRPEGLIVPGRVTVGNVGVIGTANKGPTLTPVNVGDYTIARSLFGDYDAWAGGASNELTLTRALQLAFAHGATTVYAVRVAAASAAAATYTVASASGPCVTLTAKSPGTWANDLMIRVEAAERNAFIEDEVHLGSEAAPITLRRQPIKSARNRVWLKVDATGALRPLRILYGGAPAADADAAAPAAGEVKIDRDNGQMTFGDAITAADTLTVAYAVAQAAAVKVTLKLGRASEVYTIVDGNDLVADLNSASAWVTAAAAANSAERPTLLAEYQAFKGGDDGAAAGSGEYRAGLDALLNANAHLIVAAGQDDSFGDELMAHCEQASTDAIKRDRIAIVGSRLGATIDALQGHSLDSDRVIFVAPGLKTTDDASGQEVTLPGAYAAAAIAGKLAGYAAHISLTNKPLGIGGLERIFSASDLTQLVQNRVLALEARQGFRVVKGITTATNTAWAQITTRRIVDFAKFGVRSAANPYIGLLNNARVRGALKTTINSFLAEMVDDEMLVSYDLDVSATRDDERKGIARVTMTLRPTFSIDFIKVTMFLE
jgi:hypothetical protein